MAIDPHNLSFYVQLFVKDLADTETQKGNTLTLAERARVISLRAHMSQPRFSDDRPYSVHTDFVAAGQNFSEEEKAIAQLHDSLEKTGLTSEILIFLGIPEHVVKKIEKLTIKDELEYKTPHFDGVEQILSDDECRHVRLRDTEHNSSDRDRYLEKVKNLMAEGWQTGWMQARLDRAKFRFDFVYPLTMAFLGAADRNPEWRNKNIIDFMRSAECPKHLRYQWDFLKEKSLTSHEIPEATLLERAKISLYAAQQKLVALLHFEV